MSLAATHILVPIIFLEYLRDTFSPVRKFFSRKHVFLIGIAGIMPDMDLPVFTAINVLTGTVPVPDLGHRFLLHNLWVPLGFLIFFLTFYYAGPIFASLIPKGKRPARTGGTRQTKDGDAGVFRSFGKVFLVLAMGWLFHLALDAVFTGTVEPFFPLNDFNVNINILGRLSAATGIDALTLNVSMDALLLVFWLWHEHFTHKIVEYF
jgi:membrane-bound metal-dependent hydrolase YbcI (DUF457 family)